MNTCTTRDCGMPPTPVGYVSFDRDELYNDGRYVVKNRWGEYQAVDITIETAPDPDPQLRGGGTDYNLIVDSDRRTLDPDDLRFIKERK